MTIWIAMLLGLVQGLCEFLPVSSSGHLLLLQNIFGVTEGAMFFTVMLHLAKLVAVFIAYWKTIVELIRRPFQKTVLRLIVATVPAVAVALLSKKIETGVSNIKTKDSKWGEIFLSGLFLGMISAFLGLVFAHVHEGLVGWIPVFVLLASALLMVICGLIRKVFQAKWIEDYALPISLLGGMALSIPITSLVQSIIG